MSRGWKCWQCPINLNSAEIVNAKAIIGRTALLTIRITNPSARLQQGKGTDD
ncbi:hypothetical protein U0070_011503, partial [Myodes glareolus]